MVRGLDHNSYTYRHPYHLNCPHLRHDPPVGTDHQNGAQGPALNDGSGGFLGFAVSSPVEERVRTVGAAPGAQQSDCGDCPQAVGGGVVCADAWGGGPARRTSAGGAGPDGADDGHG